MNVLEIILDDGLIDDLRLYLMPNIYVLMDNHVYIYQNIMIDVLTLHDLIQIETLIKLIIESLHILLQQERNLSHFQLIQYAQIQQFHSLWKQVQSVEVSRCVQHKINVIDDNVFTRIDIQHVLVSIMNIVIE
jgi:hypothetical protein